MIKPCFNELIAEHFPEFMLSQNRIYIDKLDTLFAIIPDSPISPLFLSHGVETLHLLRVCSSIKVVSDQREYITIIYGYCGEVLRKSHWANYAEPDFSRIFPTSFKIYYEDQGEDDLYPGMLADIYRISQEMED